MEKSFVETGASPVPTDVDAGRGIMPLLYTF